MQRTKTIVASLALVALPVGTAAVGAGAVRAALVPFDFPPITISVGDLDGDGKAEVVVLGTPLSDTIVFKRGADLLELQADTNFDGVPETVAFISNSFWDRWTVIGGGGDDIIRFELAESTHRVDSIFVDGGTGNDLVDFEMFDHGIDNHSLVLEFAGGVGDDTILVELDEVDNGQLVFRPDMGIGNDIVDIDIADAMLNLEFSVFASLGAGNDSFKYRFRPNQNAAGRCKFNTVVDAGPQDDEVLLQLLRGFDAHTNFRFDARLGDGNDTFTSEINMEGFTVGLGASIDARGEISASGGLGDDVLRCNTNLDGILTFNQTTLDGKLAFRFDGGPGNDVLDIDFGESRFLGGDPASPSAEFSALLDGGAGDDTIGLRFQTFAYAGRVAALLRGGLGNDTFSLFAETVLVDRGAPSFLEIDGGPGVDTAEVFSNVNVRKRL